jgi:hypothetical protein
VLQGGGASGRLLDGEEVIEVSFRGGGITRGVSLDVSNFISARYLGLNVLLSIGLTVSRFLESREVNEHQTSLVHHGQEVVDIEDGHGADMASIGEVVIEDFKSIDGSIFSGDQKSEQLLIFDGDHDATLWILIDQLGDHLDSLLGSGDRDSAISRVDEFLGLVDEVDLGTVDDQDGGGSHIAVSELVVGEHEVVGQGEVLLGTDWGEQTGGDEEKEPDEGGGS